MRRWPFIIATVAAAGAWLYREGARQLEEELYRRCPYCGKRESVAKIMDRGHDCPEMVP